MKDRIYNERLADNEGGESIHIDAMDTPHNDPVEPLARRTNKSTPAYNVTHAPKAKAARLCVLSGDKKSGRKRPKAAAVSAQQANNCSRRWNSGFFLHHTASARATVNAEMCVLFQPIT